MKTGTIIAICKKHGTCEHGVYTYNGKQTVNCLVCARENRAKRYKNPAKRRHDMAYTKKWYKANVDRLRETARKKAEEERRQKQEEKELRVNAFLESKKDKIKKILDRFDNPVSFKDIKRRCLREDITSIKVLKVLIAGSRASQLYYNEIYKQSTLVKYHHGVRENYQSIPEEQKQQIREEYKKKARKIVNEKMQQYAR